MTCLKEGDSGVMIDGFGMHRFDEAEIIGNLGSVRQQFTNPCSALSMLFEFKFGAGDGKAFLAGGHTGEPLCFFDEAVAAPLFGFFVVGFEELGAMVFINFGFVIEQILL